MRYLDAFMTKAISVFVEVSFLFSRIQNKDTDLAQNSTQMNLAIFQGKKDTSKPKRFHIT